MNFTIDLDCFLNDEEALSLIVRHTTNSKLIDAIAVSSINNSRVISDVIQNKCTTVTTINKLAMSENSNIRGWIAIDSRISPKILDVLANDEDWYVKYSVAANPRTSSKALAILAEDSDLGIKVQVASNPNTSFKTITQLAFDTEAEVRDSIIDNPKISINNLKKSIDILNILLGDTLPEIREKASEKRELIQ